MKARLPIPGAEGPERQAVAYFHKPFDLPRPIAAVRRALQAG